MRSSVRTLAIRSSRSSRRWTRAREHAGCYAPSDATGFHRIDRSPFGVSRFVEAPWTGVARAIAEAAGNVAATVAAARQIRTGGVHHSRAFLAGYLRDGRVSYKQPGRKRRNGE